MKSDGYRVGKEYRREQKGKGGASGNHRNGRHWEENLYTLNLIFDIICYRIYVYDFFPNRPFLQLPVALYLPLPLLLLYCFFLVLQLHRSAIYISINPYPKDKPNFQLYDFFTFTYILFLFNFPACSYTCGFLLSGP